MWKEISTVMGAVFFSFSFSFSSFSFFFFFGAGNHKVRGLGGRGRISLHFIGSGAEIGRAHV